MKVARVLAWLYAVAAASAACWALAVDLLYNSELGEHSMPNYVLLFVGAPLSGLMMWLLQALPESLSRVTESWWLQVPLMMVPAAAQAAGFFWLTRPAKK